MDSPDILGQVYTHCTTPPNTMSPSTKEANPTLLQHLNEGISNCPTHAVVSSTASMDFDFEKDNADSYCSSFYPEDTGLTAYEAGTQWSMDLLNTGVGGVFKPIITNVGDCGACTVKGDVSPIKRCRTELPTEGLSANVGGKPLQEEKGMEETPDREEPLSPQPASTSTEGKEGRSRRLRKKVSQEGRVHLCPVCGITLRPGELATHLSMERVKLDRITKPGKKSGIRGAGLQAGKVQPAPSSGTASNGSEGDKAGSQSDPTERYQNYLRIREGRQTRLCARSRKKKRGGEETTCPVCNKKVSGTPEELNEHVDNCLKAREAEDNLTVDVEGDDDTYEEYEWAGQTRIRTTTLLPGGLSASGFPTIKTTDEDDVDLDVDGNDEDSYGQPQYSERDVIPCTSDEPWENKERQALRKAFIKTELQSVESEPTDRTRWGVTPPKGKSNTKSKASCSSSFSTPLSGEVGRGEAVDELSPESISTSEEVIDCLKVRLRELEKLLGQDRPKCLICMEPHHIPVTSIQCWHVHCEECWLRTLGAKKVCPQCNMITSSADLRRIYL